ncbi:MAG: hypothetical protein ACKOOA_04110 [Sediminibacterium sp.]
MSIRSNVIISTVTSLCVSNAVVLLLCAWLKCTPCGSRQSSFVHNAHSFEPAAIPDAAGSGPLSTPSEQPLLFPDAATLPVIVDCTRSAWISLTGPPVVPYQPGRIGIHLSTGPPFADPPYYIYRYGDTDFGVAAVAAVATPVNGGAFAVFGSKEFSMHLGSYQYEADYSFNVLIV